MRSCSYCFLRSKLLYSELLQGQHYNSVFVWHGVHGKASPVWKWNNTCRLLCRVPSGTLFVRPRFVAFRPEIIKYIILVSSSIFTYISRVCEIFRKSIRKYVASLCPLCGLNTEYMSTCVHLSYSILWREGSKPVLWNQQRRPLLSNGPVSVTWPPTEMRSVCLILPSHFDPLQGPICGLFWVCHEQFRSFSLLTKHIGFSPQANYTDGATAACRRS
jgi:hypothetical protein